MPELLLGCGARRVKVLCQADRSEWSGLVTVDINKKHKPDLVWDLSSRDPLPFQGDHFDEIHAYEVLEHIAPQGDYQAFFRQFSDYWRILKPGGILYASTPAMTSRWAWGDPGHMRVFGPETLVFLDQDEYQQQVGVTPMSDYRFCYRADFETIYEEETVDQFLFALKAIKPSRCPI